MTAKSNRLPNGQYQRTLDQIYETAFDPNAFTQVSGVLAEAMQAANAVVVVSHKGVPVELSATTSPEAQADYLAYYRNIDVWTPRPFEVPMFAVTRSQARISDEAVLNSEFYQDYARHLDMWRPLGVTFGLGADSLVMIGLNRTRTAREFDAAEDTRLIDLAHHLQRALQMRTRFQNSEARALIGYSILDKLAFAVAVTDGEGGISFTNAAAKELERNDAGLLLRGGRIAAAVPADNVRLNELIRNAAKGGPGGGMRWLRRDGTSSLLALVSPLPQRLQEELVPPGQVLIALRRERDNPTFADTMLTQLFGLSRAEAEVVRAAASGASLDEIALQRDVKITTVRSQIEAAFRKTETENQRQLMRLIGTLPQIG